MTTLSKRDRLIEAAKVMFYQQGVTSSTLADIAQQAQVPLGNVYYHFRTKDSLVEAVLNTHVQELQAVFASWNCSPDPRQRLLSLLASSRDQENILARYGCPHGSLCQELDKENSPLVAIASHIFQVYLDWAETQFHQLGLDEQEAKDCAFDLISSLQGAFLLTNSFRSPTMLERKLQRLEAWIHAL
ncbi:TetR family transcriptional regulator [Ktedonobacteria bacterium brp13]|nr:TetR family transcriptional regulator [Ktedonobacteria bacterium brp13]